VLVLLVELALVSPRLFSSFRLHVEVSLRAQV
jgi:hypothetical protein